MERLELFTMIWQLFNFGIIGLTIYLIVRFFRSFSKRNKQLDNIEKKLDAISEQIKK